VKFCEVIVITVTALFFYGYQKYNSIIFDDVGIFSQHFKLVHKPVLEGGNGNNVSRFANVWQNYIC